MALVSDATVVVEAREKSGTISQAWEAIRLGRSLFIARSIVSNASLTWPPELVRYGAQVLNDTVDVLDTLALGVDESVSLAF